MVLSRDLEHSRHAVVFFFVHLGFRLWVSQVRGYCAPQQTGQSLRELVRLQPVSFQ